MGRGVRCVAGHPLRRRMALLAACAIPVMLPTSASAADSIVLGGGFDPSVAVDARGTAYVAWRGPETVSSLQYCRLPKTASACDRRFAIAVPGNSVDRPFVTVDGATVRILTHRYGLTGDFFGANYLYTSTDGGSTFDGGVPVGTITFSNAVAGPGAGISLATHATTGAELFQRVPLDGTMTTTAAVLSETRVYHGAVGLVDASTPLAVFADASDNAQMRRYAGSGDLHDPASWTPAQDIGDGSYMDLAGGPSGLFLKAVTRRLEVRRYDGTTFGAAVPVPDGTGELPSSHLAQDPGGGLHLIWPQIAADGMRVYYATSSDGRRWTSRLMFVVPTSEQEVQSMRVAAAADHEGVAVWSTFPTSNSEIRAMRVSPLRPPVLPAGKPATAQRVGKRVVVTLKGRVRPPRSVTGSDACAGETLAVVVLRGNRRVASFRVRLGRGCAFTGSKRIKASRLRRSRRIVLVVRYAGNDAAARVQRRYAVRIRGR